MNQMTNPYQPPQDTRSAEQPRPPGPPPAVDWNAFPDGRLDFAFSLEPRDVRRLCQVAGIRPLLLAVLLIVASLWLLGLLSPARPTGTAGAGLPLQSSLDSGLLLITLAAGAVTALVVWRLHGLWQKAIDQTPALVEPTHGFLCPDGIYFERAGSRGLSHWTTLCRIATSKRGVQVQAENWRMVTLLIPWQAFTDPAAAKQVFDAVRKANSIRPVILGDPRLTQPLGSETPLQFPPEPEAVTFEGTITYGDFIDTSPGRRMRLSLFRWLCGGILVLLVAIAALFPGWYVVVLFGFPLLVVAGLILYRSSRYLLRTRKRQEVLLWLRGWISPTTCCIQSATGQTAAPWTAFAASTVEDETICIRIRGSVDAWQFFPRKLFRNDQDFKSAVRWVRAGAASRSAGEELDNKGTAVRNEA